MAGGGSFVSGAVAGVCDVFANYPPYGFHCRLQRGESLRRLSIYRPRELYRGSLAYAGIVPITCITDGMTDYFKSMGMYPGAASFTSGMIAATVVSGPISNAIVINLRLKEEGKPASTIQAIKYIKMAYGVRGFYAGILPLLFREGSYSWSVFYVKGEVQRRYGYGDIKSSVIAGTIASVMSQPCDTLTTFIQNQVERKGVVESAKMMWKDDVGGVLRYYRGFWLRWYSIVAGVYVMSSVSGIVKGVIYDNETKSKSCVKRD